MRKKFTLIELLVVVAIIAILAGMLLPVLNRARESGKRTSCMSTMKQYGLALTQYADAGNGFFPWYYNAFNYHTSAYRGLLGESGLIPFKQKPMYVRTDILRCPNRVVNTTAGSLLGNFSYDYNGTYSMNGVFSSIYGDGLGTPTKTTGIFQPSRLILLGEKGSPNDFGFTSFSVHSFTRFSEFHCKANPLSVSGDTVVLDLSAHGNASNYLFVDGHVEGITYQTLRWRICSLNSSANDNKNYLR